MRENIKPCFPYYSFIFKINVIEENISENIKAKKENYNHLRLFNSQKNRFEL